MANAKQLELRPADLPHFDGEPEPCEGKNRARLGRQLQRVFDVMVRAHRASQWLTLREIADMVGCSAPSASARLRDLRKEKIMGAGICTVERRLRNNIRGLYEYRVLTPQADREEKMLAANPHPDWSDLVGAEVVTPRGRGIVVRVRLGTATVRLPSEAQKDAAYIGTVFPQSALRPGGNGDE